MVNRVVSWRMHHQHIPVAAMMLCLVSGTALAERVSVTGELSSRHTDNVGKTEPKESGAESTARIGVRHTSDPGRCNSDLDASLGYSYWHDDYYDPESRAEAGFNGNCEIRPWLNWELTNDLSEVLQSSRQNDTPDNRTRRNIFRTGPVLTVPLSAVDQLRASVQYGNTEYEDPQLRDSERYTGSLGWNHQFDSTLSGGLSASSEQQELDNGAETESSSVNLNLSKTWPASSLNASLGGSQQETRFDSVEQTSEGVVGSLSLTREINPSASFYISASRQLTDQASDFALRFGDVAFDYTEETGVEVTALDMGLNKSFSDGTLFDIRVYANRSDYLQTDERENAAGLSFNVNRPIRPHLSLRGGGSYQYRHYEESSRDDELASANIGLSYSLTQDLDCTASIGHSTRESDLPTAEYNENWVQVALSYRFL